MFRLSLKMTLARKGRLILTSLAIILGTSFLSGTYIFSDTLNKTFERLFSDVFRDVDAYVRSSSFVEVDFGGEQRSSTPIEALETVLAVPGVKDAVGDIQGFARIIGKDGTPLGADNGPPTFGGIAASNIVGLWNIEEGRLAVGPTEVVLDKASADNGDFVLGDTVRVNAQSGSREFTLVGIANYGDVSSPGGATFALFDQPTASEFLLKPGLVDAFLIQGDGSLSDEELANAVNKALDPADKLETLTGAEITEETQGQIQTVLNFLTTFLKVFSYIALGIGCFVIYNVFSITAAQRLRENALMRAIGASKRQVATALLVEATIVGVLGSLMGFVAGIGISRGLSALLKAFGAELPTKGLTIQTSAFVTTMIVGVLVTIFSAVFPALRAGRVLPLAALRDTALETIGSNVKRFVIAFIILALGIVAITAAANDAPLGVLGLGVLFVFTAVLIMGPGISRPVALTLGQPIRKIRGVTGGMARQNAARNPKRTARTAAPVLIGVALVTAFASFASSFKSEIRDTIGSQFKGDFAISVSNNGFGGLPITLVDEIGALPEVAQATGLGFATITLDGKGRFVQVINPKTTAGLIDLEMVSGSQSALSANGILVSDTRAIAKDWSIGTPLDIVLVDGTTKTVTIEGTFVASGFTGSYVINRDLFADTTNTLFDNSIYVTLKPGVSADVARAKIEALSSEKGLGKVESRAEFIDAQSSQIDQFFGIIYGLLFLSIIIAIVGIVITLLLSVFERRREIGLLRAVGMTRGQAWESITWESVITSFIGAVTGIVLGIVMGAVLITVLSSNGISTFRLPVGTTIFILIMAFIVGVIAAVYPAWRATRTDIISAIATN